MREIPHGHVDYADFLNNLRAHFSVVTKSKTVLMVSSVGLWAVFLSGIAARYRQSHTCAACRHFVEQWGGVAVVGDSGVVESALWSLPGVLVPQELRLAVSKLCIEVSRRSVSAAFVPGKRVLGTPVAGGYAHLSIDVPEALVWRSPVKTAGQRAAELVEGRRCLEEALGYWPEKAFVRLLDLLEYGGAERVEKFKPHAEWLANLKGMMRRKPKPYRENLLWRAAAKAPDGWCMPRAQVIGALLDDLADGLPYDVILKKHAEKLDPLKYQRPQTAPAAGTIARAEALFEKLNLGRALERRLARVSDMYCVWKPAPKAGGTGGLFSHLKATTKHAVDNVMKREAMSWRIFCESFLDKGVVAGIDAMVPAFSRAFVQFTAAVHEDAEPILKWDRPDARNHASWYFYAAKQPSTRYGLKPGTWARCIGIAKTPSWVGNEHGHGFPDMPTLLLEGAYDHGTSHLGLFPETLRSELHEVRSVIEAHCGQHVLVKGEGDGEIACGLSLPHGSTEHSVMIRATLRNGVKVETTIDRLL